MGNNRRLFFVHGFFEHGEEADVVGAVGRVGGEDFAIEEFVDFGEGGVVDPAAVVELVDGPLHGALLLLAGEGAVALGGGAFLDGIEVMPPTGRGRC